MPHEREGDASEIRTSTKTAYDYIRILPCNLHLLFRLKTDYSLMKGDMVHHGTESIFTSRGHAGKFYCFRYGSSKRPLMIRHLCENILSCAR